jgi:hypothetical protein
MDAAIVGSPGGAWYRYGMILRRETGQLWRRNGPLYSYPHNYSPSNDIAFCLYAIL